LEVRFVRDLRAYRMKASASRINLSLRDLPNFTAGVSREQLTGHIQVCPDLDYLEHAYDDAKYGGFSRQPYLDAVIPTLLDPSLSSSGGHLMNITVQYTPYRLSEGCLKFDG
jgi:phytoene dehydrogenase-like protein